MPTIGPAATAPPGPDLADFGEGPGLDHQPVRHAPWSFRHSPAIASPRAPQLQRQHPSIAIRRTEAPRQAALPASTQQARRPRCPPFVPVQGLPFEPPQPASAEMATQPSQGRGAIGSSSFRIAGGSPAGPRGCTAGSSPSQRCSTVSCNTMTGSPAFARAGAGEPARATRIRASSRASKPGTLQRSHTTARAPALCDNTRLGRRNRSGPGVCACSPPAPPTILRTLPQRSPSRRTRCRRSWPAPRISAATTNIPRVETIPIRTNRH